MNEEDSVEISSRKKPTSGRRVLRALRSVKLAVSLLVAIAAAMIVATVMKNQAHARRYVYHSWWFIALLGLFCLNLILCTAGRWSLRLKRLGTTVTHAGVLVMVAGAVISTIWGERGAVRLWIGDGTEVCYDDKGQPVQLPFEIHLDKFEVEHYSKPNDALIVHGLAEGVAEALPIEVGREFEIEGTSYKVSILRYEPDFVVLGRGEYGSRSKSPNNPAIEVRVSDDLEDEAQWVFLRFPGMHRNQNSKVLLDYARVRGNPKDFKSNLRLMQAGQAVASKTIEVNKPLKYAGWTIYQSSYDRYHEAWSGLGVAKDPGVRFVYLGFVLISAGVLFRFYVRPILTGRTRSRSKQGAGVS